jgi:hypothetical protein
MMFLVTTVVLCDVVDGGGNGSADGVGNDVLITLVGWWR